MKHLLTSTILSLTILSSSLMGMSLPGDSEEGYNVKSKLPSSTREAVKKKSAADFKGSDQVDLAMVKAYRDQLQTVNAGDEDFQDLVHNPSLLPLVEKLESFLEGKTNNKNLARLLDEIKFHKKWDDISPRWIFDVHFRMATALGERTADEIEIFSHVVHPEVFFGMLTPGATVNSLSAYLSVEKYDTRGNELPQYWVADGISPEATDELSIATRKALPKRALYPCLEAGKFGIPFLIECILQDVFPAGFPTTTLRGHGSTLSMYGFAAHEVLHSLLDRRQYELVSYVMREATKYYESGGNIPLFIEVAPKVAAAKYTNLMQSLYDIYDAMVTAYATSDDKPLFHRDIAGFFWILHEKEGSFPSEIYGLTELQDALNMATSFPTNETEPTEHSDFSTYDSWDSSFDPLETSPITGASPKSDEEIYSLVIGNMTMGDANCYKYTGFYSEIPIQENNIVQKSIKRTERFIDVAFKLRDGSELAYSFPTLYHKWANMNDNLALLRYAGNTIAKPDLSQQAGPREAAQAVLLSVEIGIQSLVQHFRERAIHFALIAKEGEGSSIAERFSQRVHHLDEQLQQQLSQK